MIKKLDIKDYKDKEQLVWFGIIYKINELVDAVNELQKHEEQHLDLLTQLNEMRLHQKKEPTISKMEKVESRSENVQTDTESRSENVQDEFAEQRKWEGKLCWFWDADPEDKIVDILSCIDISDKYPYVMCDRQVHYKHCEPVKPDDDIIYRGE